MTTSLTARLAAAALGVTVAIGLCELAARSVFPAPPDSAREPQLAYQYDPELRFLPVPSQWGWVDGGRATVNAMGFRGAETATPKPAGRYRIVTIGDSLTFGWGVDDDQTYSARVERLLHERRPTDDVDVVNAGVGGYNTRQAIARLARVITPLEPDLVLLGFYSNDVPDALDDDEAGGAGNTRIVGNPVPGQVLHINPAPELSSWWRAQLRRSRAAHVAVRAAKQIAGRSEESSPRFAIEMDLLHDRPSAKLDLAWEKIGRQFQALADLAAANHFSVGVVILPCREQVLGEFPQADYQRRVRELASSRGFLVVDPLPLLSASAGPRRELFIPYDRNHPSAEGHALIAQAIADELLAGRHHP